MSLSDSRRNDGTIVMQVHVSVQLMSTAQSLHNLFRCNNQLCAVGRCTDAEHGERLL
jgi:hypothetical protein